MKLLPPPGIRGFEIDPPIRIERGRRFTIVSVWKEKVLLDNGVYYRIRFDDTNESDAVPTIINLYFLGNEERDGELNFSNYRRLPGSK